MKKVLYYIIYACIITSIIFLGVGSSCVEKDIDKDIRFIFAYDSSVAVRAPLLIFKKGKKVIDTSANWEGEFRIRGSVKKIIATYPGCYPNEISHSELLKDSVFSLKKSEILDNYPAIDSELINMQEKVLKQIENWNKRN